MADIPADALIVVADGRGARLFRNQGSAHELSLKQESSLKPKHLMEEGPSGSRPEEQSPQQTDEATFSKQLANMLHTQLEEKKYKALVLIADPQSLGQIRDAMHASVKQSLVLSLNKELTGHSLLEIEKALRTKEVEAR